MPKLPSSKRKGFNSLFALVSGQLWRERNNRGTSTSIQQLAADIKRDAELWIQAGATKLGCLVSEWLFFVVLLGPGFLCNLPMCNL